MRKVKASTKATEATPEQIRAIVTGADQVFDLKELKRRFNLKGDTTVREWIRRGILPKPVKIGGASRWLLSQIGGEKSAA
jgi:predicted DNA-binding transcriptional regulator AlpA